MQHRRPTDLTSILRALGVLLVGAALGSTVLAAAGGNDRDPASDVLQIARQQLGDPYGWGATGPDRWDCSGLTSRLWREVGGVKDIPRISRDQHAWAVPIPAEQLLVGDLVFFGNPVTHVALYAGGGMIVDSSSARRQVIERRIWTSGLVRYGRVPRSDMPAVKPWTPPPPPPPAPAAAVPAATKGGTGPTAATAPAPPSPSVVAALARLVPLRGLRAPDLPAASVVAARAAANATSVRGSRHWTDLELVRVAWHHAGGGALPTTPSRIEAKARAVPLAQARIGDLVVYGKPASHIGVYLGHGYMVDTSPSLRRVVVRRVFVSPTVRLARLPAS